MVHSGTLQPDGTLTLAQPPKQPPGPVIIAVQPSPAATSAKRGLADLLDDIRRRQQSRGYQGRSIEEIEAVRREGEAD